MKKILLLLALFLASNAFAQTTTDSFSNEAVDSILQSYCHPDKPGLAVGIVKNGKVLYKNTAGIADLSNSIPITDSTVFNIASVSKHFTALVALMAEEEGKLSLDDDVRKYLPELQHLPQKITIKQLANHSHGLPNFSEVVQLMGFTGQDPSSNTFAVETMLATRQVNFEPGTRFQYGNTGYMLLAEVLKRVYEKPFPRVVQEKLFQPLSMTQSAVIDDSRAVVKNKAQAYRWSGTAYVESANRQMESGPSNVHTSLNDMLKWLINFQNPKVGGQVNQLATKTIALVEDGGVDYGLGLFSENYKGLNTVFHGGGTAGYRAYIL
ncbi:MAG: serine hydrolase domain-containing protein, partial [Bacteroidota bacterium]